MVNPRKPNTNRADFDTEKESLHQKFGRPPSDLDVIWSLLNKERLKHAQAGKWGLYRNDTLDMADALFWTHHDARGLPFYLEVCYLDLNNPSNSGLIDDPKLLAEFPPFSIDPNGMAPVVLALAAKSIKLSGQSPQQVQTDFLARSAKIHESLRLPLSPEKAWTMISDALAEVS
jgi:hypothetical protein